MMQLPWIRKIATHLKEYDQIPLYGNAPHFDWGRFSTLLASRFGMPQFSLGQIKQSWRTPEELKEGLGQQAIVLPITLDPLAGSAFWIMSRESVAKLTSWMLSGNGQAQPLASEILAEGFYRFLILQVMDVASSLEPLQKLSMILNEESDLLVETEALCVDVELSFDKRSCWGRFVMDHKLHKSWISHFSSLPSSLSLGKFTSHVELSLGIQVGSILLEKKEWKSLKKGDFVFLNQAGYDLKKHTGIGSLTLGGEPLFSVKIKPHKIELLEHPFIYEEKMDKSPEQYPPSSEEAKPVSIKETPVYVTVEIARLKMSLEKLLQLAPGNLLELPIHPEQGVSLTVNGQLIGKAELVHLGEALGIRLLEKG